MSQPTRSNSEVGNEEIVTRPITRACDTCRRRKIRCEPTSDVCVPCVKSKSPCHFTPMNVLKSRRRMTKDRRIEELEKRLAWMEDQLRQQQIQAQKHDADSQHVADLWVQDDTASTINQFSIMPSHDFGKSSLSSGSFEDEDYTRVSPLSHVDALSQQMLIHQYQVLSFNPTTNPIHSNPVVYHPLPPIPHALRLINSYFTGLNVIHTLFSPSLFLFKFHHSYPPSPSRDPDWYASLNIVFALSYQYWELPDPDSNEDGEAWGYFQNACAMVGRLVTGRYTVGSAQALLGLAMMVQMAVPTLQKPVAMLISSAVGVARGLGLHRTSGDDGMGGEEAEERRRVFWLAYCMDKDVCLELRQPPSLGDEDMDVEPPEEDERGDIYRNLFVFRVRLAVIQGQVYRRLLSVRAEKQSPTERAYVAQELESALQAWRREIPINLFSDYSGALSEGPQPETYRHPVYLQLLYFKTMAILQESLLVSSWQYEIASSEVRVHVLSARAAYPADARSAMKLFNVTPKRKFTCIWCTLHIFITAATTLLSYTISNTSSSLLQPDLELLGPFLNLLGVVAKSGRHDEAAQKYQFIMNLVEQASVATERRELEMSVQHQVVHANFGAKESVEEFIERMERIAAGDGVVWEEDGVR